jgi:hypothetical protein
LKLMLQVEKTVFLGHGLNNTNTGPSNNGMKSD